MKRQTVMNLEYANSLELYHRDRYVSSTTWMKKTFLDWAFCCRKNKCIH